MSVRDDAAHVRGRSLFLDDLPEPAGLLHAAVLASTVAHGMIVRVDTAAARCLPLVRDVLTADMIPGENQVGGIVADEPLLASGEVVYAGEPVALVVAETGRAARAALAAITLEIDPLPVLVDPREAFARGELIGPTRTFALGAVEGAWAGCDAVVSGRADTGGQEHFYLEGQAAMAVPGEDGRVHIFSSTQAPTTVQRAAARVLGVPMQSIEVEVGRIGGGFGGKEDQATPWAVMAALAAQRTGRPVKLVLRRREDMRMTGKRHPYSADYRIGVTRDGRIRAYEVAFYQNAGACADLSPAVLERTLFHATGSYFVPNVRATGSSCRTNLVPFTAFRGFGAPQAMFVIEAAIVHAAAALGRRPREIQEINLLSEGDAFPYGMRAEECRARRCWTEADRACGFAALEARAEEHNRAGGLTRKGVAMMPVCFGISFTNTALNQGRALVHVYSDGSVGISTGAVEMGQGVNEKLRRVAARVLSIRDERVQIETTDTTRVANASATSASCGADLNGKAVEMACRAILGRLAAVAAGVAATAGAGGMAAAASGRAAAPAPAPAFELRDERVFLNGVATDVSWPALVQAACAARVSLSEHAHYATPDIWFDKTREQGHPFAYHAYGTAVVEVTLDCLRGTCTVDSVRCVHDVGDSLAPEVDRGQIEGGIVQGLGWMTLEELRFDGNGRLLTDTPGTYKVPDIKSTPRFFDVRFLQEAGNARAVLGSKAAGEPPLMYGIAACFAILDAMRAFNPMWEAVFDAPMTPEKILMALYRRGGGG
jgi:xanthine dehydrogenase large subunit